MYKYCNKCKYRTLVGSKDSCCNYFLKTGELRKYTKTDCLVFEPKGGDDNGRNSEWNSFQRRDGIL